MNIYSNLWTLKKKEVIIIFDIIILCVFSPTTPSALERFRIDFKWWYYFSIVVVPFSQRLDTVRSHEYQGSTQILINVPRFLSQL